MTQPDPRPALEAAIERLQLRADLREPLNDPEYPYRREYYLADLALVVAAAQASAQRAQRQTEPPK